MHMILVSTAVMVLGGLICLLAGNRSRMVILILIQAVAFGFAVPACIHVLLTGTPLTWSIVTASSHTIEFSVDALSSFFVLLITGFALLTALFMTGSLKPYSAQGRSVRTHIFLFPLFIASMLILVISRNAVIFLMSWESMSFFSFFLIVLENEKKEVLQAGIRYFVTMQAGVLLLFASFLFLYSKTGSPNIQDWSAMLSARNVSSTVLFWLLFSGFAVKAGFFPLHSWLPHAHPAAPSHISAIMSGVMIKTGIYGILRILMYCQPLPAGSAITIIIISMLSALWGVLHALGQHDLKRLLAFHSIENIGIIGLGIGFGILGRTLGNPLISVLGYSGAVLHVFNHAVFKSLLFFGAGSVYQTVHTRDMEKMGGLIKIMPVTATGFLIGAAAISGLPPLNGFISELMIFLSMLNGLSPLHAVKSIISLFSLAGLALTGALATACFVKAFSIVFLGKPRSDHGPAQKSEVQVSMLLPMMILTVTCFLPAFFPSYTYSLFQAIVRTLTGESLFLRGAGQLLPVLFRISIITWCFTGFFLLVILFRYLLNRVNGSSRNKVWACGFQATNSRMQYTASSFGRSILGLFGSVVGYKIKEPLPAETFNMIPPAVTATTSDIVESRTIHPLFRAIKKIFGWFSWIQSGRSQDYLVYGIVFLLLIMILGLAGVI